MFNFLSKKSPTISPKENETNKSDICLKIQNLDCPTCAIDLDISLEEIPGIISAKTNYAKSECRVTFDPNNISPKTIETKIAKILST